MPSLTTPAQLANGAQVGDGSAAHAEVGKENLALRKLVALCGHLTSLAAQNAGIQAVTELIAERTDATVAVVDQQMAVLVAALPGESSERAATHIQDHVVHPRLANVLNTTSHTRRPLRLPDTESSSSLTVAPILVGDEVPAYLMTLGTGGHGFGEDMSLLLSEHAATICGVIMGRERVVAAAAGRARDDLVAGLLSGRANEDGEVQRWARHVGYDETQEHHVLSIVLDPVANQLDDDRGEELLARLSGSVDHFFATQAPDAIVSTRDSEMVVVLPATAERHPGSRATRLGDACLKRVRRQFSDVQVTIGIGRPCRDAVDIARSYADARRTIETARRMGRLGRVVAFDDLGIHRLLLQTANLDDLRTFAREVLGPLGHGDKAGAAEYLSTLSAYFRENYSPQRASRELHVHPNTVTYRIKKVEEITGLDLGNYRDRLMAQVALEILDAVGDGR
ncbi:MAG: hypothetical protein GEU98_17600 [Pseudonocardiaceae bacterium]|nr:hypothetical protein [Pseudonocardiaceae bacterium]